MMAVTRWRRWRLFSKVLKKNSELKSIKITIKVTTVTTMTTNFKKNEKIFWLKAVKCNKNRVDILIYRPDKLGNMKTYQNLTKFLQSSNRETFRESIPPDRLITFHRLFTLKAICCNAFNFSADRDLRHLPINQLITSLEKQMCQHFQDFNFG